MKRLALLLTLLIPVLLISQPCLPDGISFTTQAEIDSFPINYPGCTEIEGTVIISEGYPPIYNLDSLYILTSIRGNLLLNALYDLQNINGLENLTVIGGKLIIGTAEEQSSGGTSLINLDGLEGLDSIYGGLHITANGQLTDLSAMNGLAYLGGQLIIRLNSSLAVCQTEWLCEYLLSPNGAVSILQNAPGCNSIIEIGSNCNDSLPCLPYGNYYFITQTDIDNFQNVFPGCTDLEGGVYIGGDFGFINTDVTNLSGLNTVNTIAGYLSISHNGALTSLAGIEGLTAIGGNLWVGHNDTLTSLTGLEGLTTIGGDYLSIKGNHALSSITGLEGLTSIGGDLGIIFNESLSICDVTSVCNYLVAPNGEIDIHDNAPGCNTQKEVEDACASSINEIGFLTGLAITPNPFTTSTTIEYTLNSPQTVTFTFYNQFGKEVDRIEQKQAQGKQQVAWTPDLPGGIYYFRLEAGEQVASGKVVLMR